MTVLWIFQSSCGGTIISANRVITAAHCKDDGQISAQSFTAIFGSNILSSGGLRVGVPVIDVIMHPQWTPSTAANDIAVMRLPSSIGFTSKLHS